MSTSLAHIADLVLNRPLLILPDKLAVVASVLEGRIGIDASGLKPDPDASRFVGTWQDGESRRTMPYKRTADGTAVITIAGSLVNRGAWIGANSGLVSYEAIKHQVAEAASDEKVRTIVLDLATPGGEAVGAFEVADVVRAAAAVKPVVAVVNGMAASAGYAIPSGATRIVTTPSGITGSIGVVMLHADFSRKFDREGVTPTLIHAGARKVDGNPYVPLSEAVRTDLQAEIDRFYALFVDTVAAGRKGLSADAIRATEARTFIGADAVAAGLADELGSFESVLQSTRAPAGRKSLPKGHRMSSEDAKFTQAELERARAEGHAAGKAEGEAGKAEAVAAAKTAGTAEGAAAERERIKTIVGSEEAKGRQAQAVALATSTSVAAEEAKAVLKATPSSSSLEQRFGPEQTSGLGPDASGAGGGGSSAAASWDSFVAKQNALLKGGRA